LSRVALKIFEGQKAQSRQFFHYRLLQTVSTKEAVALTVSVWYLSKGQDPSELIHLLLVVVALRHLDIVVGLQQYLDLLVVEPELTRMTVKRQQWLELFLVLLAVLLEWLLPGDLLLFQQERYEAEQQRLGVVVVFVVVQQLTELVVELQNEKRLDHDERYY
jgi:hypothetical protein